MDLGRTTSLRTAIARLSIIQILICCHAIELSALMFMSEGYSGYLFKRIAELWSSIGLFYQLYRISFLYAFVLC